MDLTLRMMPKNLNLIKPYLQKKIQNKKEISTQLRFKVQDDEKKPKTIKQLCQKKKLKKKLNERK